MQKSDEPGAYVELITTARLTRLTVVLAVATLASGLKLGCGLPQRGLNPCGGVEFEVSPLFICPGEEITVRWTSTPERIPCDEFFDRRDACLGTVPEHISVILGSTPPLFEGRGTMDIDEHEGERSFTLTEDTQVRLTVLRQIKEDVTAFCEPDPYLVQVLDPTLGETGRYVLAFPFGCTAAGGAAGWTPTNIRRGAIASSCVHVQRVTNLSAFPIRLMVERLSDDPDIPPLAIVELEGSGSPADSTLLIDNEFYGVWTAAPLNPEALGPTGCDEGTTGGDVIADPDNGGPIVPPIPDIRLEVTLECVCVN